MWKAGEVFKHQENSCYGIQLSSFLSPSSLPASPPPALPPLPSAWLSSESLGPGSTTEGCVNGFFSFSEFSASSSVKRDENALTSGGGAD